MNTIQIPKSCPSCGAEVRWSNDQIFCTNEKSKCPAQSEKTVEHYCKVAKIKGFGPQTIKKLELTSISDLYSLTVEGISEVLGEKMGEKLFKEVQSKTSMEFSTFLAALSIPLVGGSAARKLESRFDSFEGITYEQARECGLGDKAAQNLVNWLEGNLPMLRNLPVTFKEVERSEAVVEKSDYVFCITGKLDGYTRTSAASALESLGGTVKSSVTKAVTHLVCEEDKLSSSKKKAIAMEIPILTMPEALNLLESK